MSSSERGAPGSADLSGLAVLAGLAGVFRRCEGLVDRLRLAVSSEIQTLLRSVQGSYVDRPGSAGWGRAEVWAAASAASSLCFLARAAAGRCSSLRKPKTCVDRKLYLTCLWPGLPELWWRGRLAALPTAIAFAAATNFLLVARFIYPEWLTLGLVRMAGWVGVAVWLFCVLRSVRDMPGLLNPRQASGRPDRFVEAHQAYLRSQWAEAESLLTDCLSVEHRDPPAMLLLAGVYRHTGRIEAAERLIEELRLTEVADRWWLEIEAEEKRLQRDRSYRLAGTRSAAAVVAPTEVSHSVGQASVAAEPAERAGFSENQAA